jgi:tRNA (cytidine/uridine-2'-O-)-methyltransferase
VEGHEHPGLDSAEAEIQRAQGELARSSRTWLFSGKATRSYLDVQFELGDALVFGKESVGLPDALLAARTEVVLGIPTLGEVRSLNLANSVAISLFEALRQVGGLRVDPNRR